MILFLQASIPESYELIMHWQVFWLTPVYSAFPCWWRSTQWPNKNKRYREHSSGTVRDSNPVPF